MIAIGILRFVAGTFFEYTATVKVIDIGLYVVAIVSGVMYLRLRFKNVD